MSREQVRAYYAARGICEWDRLEQEGDGALEFAMHRAAIATHLPPGGRVLDLGGGPGRYTIWLAERGHHVALADLSPELLAIARRQIAAAGVAALVPEVVEADACDLRRWPDGSFDAVLCLGPFYHLPDSTDRERAAAELVRVLRPGGLAFVALMPIYAFPRRTLALEDEQHHLKDPGFIDHLLTNGVFRNDVPGRFTDGHGVRPSEVEPFFARHGLQMRTLIASTGFAPDLQATVQALKTANPAVYQAAFELLMQTAADPSILGMANHLLYVGAAAT